MKQKVISFLALILAFTVIFTLTACTNSPNKETASPTQEAEKESAEKETEPSTENIEETKAKDESVKDDENKKEETAAATEKSSEPKVESVYSEGNFCTNNTNSYSGNSASKPSSFPEPTQNEHKHNWKTTTIHHNEIGHNETMVMVEMVVVGCEPMVENYVCEDCGQWSADEDFCTIHSLQENHHSGYSIKVTGGEPIYESRETSEDIWVVDTPAWDEKITKCTGCGKVK